MLGAQSSPWYQRRETVVSAPPATPAVIWSRAIVSPLRPHVHLSEGSRQPPGVRDQPATWHPGGGEVGEQVSPPALCGTLRARVPSRALLRGPLRLFVLGFLSMYWGVCISCSAFCRLFLVGRVFPLLAA